LIGFVLYSLIERQTTTKDFIMETAKRHISDHAAVGKLIRKELKEAFPGTKFSVRGECFAGGDAVRVSYTDSVPSGEVEAIANKYKSGSFNAMEDIFEYNQKEGPTVKYITVSRTISEEHKQEFKNQFADYYSGDFSEYDQDRMQYQYLSKKNFDLGTVDIRGDKKREEEPEAAQTILPNLNGRDEIEKKILNDDISPDELKEFSQKWFANAEQIKKEVSNLYNVKQLKSMVQVSYATKKADFVKKFYDQTFFSFIVCGSMVSYGLQTTFAEAALSLIMKTTTAETITAAAKKRNDEKAEREEYKKSFMKSLKNPKTLKEFKTFISIKGLGHLSPEQEEKFDSLQASRTTEAREQEQKNISSSHEKISVDSEDFIITEDFHTKKEIKIFIVKAKKHFEKTEFFALKARAKKNNGYYSRYSTGFIFETLEDAKNFCGLDNTPEEETETPEAPETPETAPETPETAPETPETAPSNEIEEAEKAFSSCPSLSNEIRLNEAHKQTETPENKNALKLKGIAKKIIDRENENLNRDRLTNTPKRAREAAYAEETAQKAIFQAELILKVAEAIEKGDTKYLKNIKNRAQVERLEDELNFAHRVAAKKGENENGPSVDDITHARSIEALTLNKEAGLSIAKEIENIPGFKLLSKRLRVVNPWDTDTLQVSKWLEDLKKIEKQYKKNQIPFFWQLENELKRIKNFHSLGLQTDSEAREALRELARLKTGLQAPTKCPIKEAQRALIGQKNIGIEYFPTPKELVQKMLSYASIFEGAEILEPSAGAGHIADIIKEEHKNISLDCFEWSNTLQNILSLKGHDIKGNDFFECKKQYDFIIMNPPFSKNQDIDHIKHAFKCLKNGGRIVSIMSEHAFFSSGTKETDFINFIDENGFSEKLPEGSFKNSDVRTGVNTRIVVLDK
jgi:phospholipid N-methyltransferase